VLEQFDKKLTQPENCIIGFGIPTSEAAYLQSREAAEERFARRYQAYAAYEYQVIEPYNRLAPRLRRLGVKIIPDLTLAQFKRCFAEASVHAVILFSHWNDEAIEFHDGYAAVPEIVESVPYEYTGVVDLCVCHPESLIPELRRRRPNCCIHHIRATATPLFWLNFYAAVFHYLRRAHKRYLEVLDMFIINWIKQSQIYNAI